MRWALLYGGAFGLGRSIPAWAGMIAGLRADPGAITKLLFENKQKARWPGLVAAAAGIVVILTTLGPLRG